MPRRTPLAFVLSLCAAGVLAPTSVTAATGPPDAPARAIADATDGTSNTIMLADSSLRLQSDRNGW
jgi:hypothetical protein